MRRSLILVVVAAAAALTGCGSSGVRFQRALVDEQASAVEQFAGVPRDAVGIAAVGSRAVAVNGSGEGVVASAGTHGTERFALDGGASAIAPGHGVVWVGVPRALLRVDPAAARVTGRIALPAGCGVVGSILQHGALYATCPLGGLVVELDPVRLTLTRTYRMKGARYLAWLKGAPLVEDVRAQVRWLPVVGRRRRPIAFRGFGDGLQRVVGLVTDGGFAERLVLSHGVGDSGFVSWFDGAFYGPVPDGPDGQPVWSPNVGYPGANGAVAAAVVVQHQLWFGIGDVLNRWDDVCCAADFESHHPPLFDPRTWRVPGMVRALTADRAHLWAVVEADSGPLVVRFRPPPIEQRP